jgi:hypothetical protein
VTVTTIVILRTGLISEPELAGMAARIRETWNASIDAQFEVGRVLAQARLAFPSDTLYGQWLRREEFPFSQATAHRLRYAGANERAVRKYMRANATKRGWSVTTTVKQMCRRVA